MSNPPHDQKISDRQAKIVQHDHRVEHFFRHILHFLERVVATITLIVLVIALIQQVVTLVIDPSHIADINEFLHHILTIVVGLEFVRMLIDTTPANILEVLTMALSRGIIVNHGSAIDNLLSIACILAMFAARRYLIPRSELHKGMDEELPEHHHHRGHRKSRHKAEEHKEPAQQ